eukprot:1138119-Pelagomonas_calceolata.AAC.10
MDVGMISLAVVPPSVPASTPVPGWAPAPCHVSSPCFTNHPSGQLRSVKLLTPAFCIPGGPT